MKKIILMVMFGMLLCGLSWADGYEFNLSAGDTSVAGGVHYKGYLDSGYLKRGLRGVYTEGDNSGDNNSNSSDPDYRWLALDLMVGNELIAPGLACEIGLNATFGNAEYRGLSGDVGAFAFSGRVAYVFPSHLMPIPLELFGTLSYAPRILSFMDSELYRSHTMGVGLRIVENASLFIEFANYDIEMETTDEEWELDDSVIRLGMIMRF